MQLMIMMMMMSRGGGYALSGITIRGICVVQVKVEEKRRARFMSCKGLLLLLYVHFLGNPLHSYELFTIIRHTCPPGCSAAVKVHSRDIN